MGLFRKKQIMALTPLQVEKARLEEQMKIEKPGTPEYKELIFEIKSIDELIEKEDLRRNPPKDKLTKADKAKLALWGVGMLSTFAIEQIHPYEAGKSMMRRFSMPNFVPRFWGKDMDCEQKTPQPKR